MNLRELENIIRDTAEEMGAAVLEFGRTSRHRYAIISLGGVRRKFVFGGNRSDPRAHLNIRTDVRKTIRSIAERCEA